MDVPRTMRAVRIGKVTYGRDVQLAEISVPAVQPGWVLVQVKAFGLNDVERKMRHGGITRSDARKPIVPGVECAGVVVDPSDSPFKEGAKVICCAGGLGTLFNGTYAEYVLVPSDHVFSVPDDVSWDWIHLAAFPETYLMAWGSLFDSLQLEPFDLLLIRGATCGVGYAAIQLAKALGARVVAASNRKEKLPLLKEAGANKVVLDEGMLFGQVKPADKVLDLVGASTLRDSLRCTAYGSIVCASGTLGGLDSLGYFDPIRDVPNHVYLTGFLGESPSQELYDEVCEFMVSRKLEPIVNIASAFEDIAAALARQDSGSGGKLVIAVEQ